MTKFRNVSQGFGYRGSTGQLEQVQFLHSRLVFASCLGHELSGSQVHESRTA